MSASRGESALETTAQEIFKLLKRLFDARNQLRSKIFTQRVDPLIEQIRLSHSEFTFVIAELKKILLKLTKITNERTNDLNAELEKLETRIEDVVNRRNEGRTSRRELFSEANVLLTKMNNAPKHEALVLSDEETNCLRKFFSEIQTYLSNSELIYAHDLGNYLRVVDRLVSRAIRNGLDKNLESDCEQLIDSLEKYEADREKRWLLISEQYANLKHSLPR
ncbi:hypothetical protein [Roseibium sp. SCP14]|uniref:hypothetical protein n=1 Tax=Roseibium sp. SCP14 TaxID=3141375 RepID=UPI00333A96AA